MGAGKTTVGKVLARDLGLTFVDADQELQRRTGVTISVIFDIEGESGFRAREAALLDELTQRTGVVLATGGGAVLREENRGCLKSRGLVVYLRANLDDLWARTRHDRNRPLLQNGNPKKKLAELLAERDPLYCETADLIVDTSRQSVQALARRIEKRLEEVEGKNGGPRARADADSER
jgi:shikimate kinase